MLPNLPNSLKKADMDNELWIILLPIILLPVFFTMGWFAARVDMKTVLKQAKASLRDFIKAWTLWSTATAGARQGSWRKSSTTYRNRMI